MSDSKKTALEYGENENLDLIQFKLKEIRAKVKATKTKLSEQEYELNFLKIAEQTAIAKQQLLKNSQPDLGRADEWDE